MNVYGMYVWFLFLVLVINVELLVFLFWLKRILKIFIGYVECNLVW